MNKNKKSLFLKPLFVVMVVVFFGCTPLLGTCQFTIRLVVTNIATKQNDDNVYVSGTFNNWNPNDDKYLLKPSAGGRKVVVIRNLPPGMYAFKFTRGSFDKVECMADGRDINDRQLEVNNDITQEISIAGWKDDYPERPKKYTASPQVRLMDTAFAVPQLKCNRRIWMYLPKSYAVSSKTYPVLYMHDGQNLFNEQTAGLGGEWGVDECLDSLQKQLGKEAIVIGIDHGGDRRMNEYNPYYHFQYGKGEGKEYIDFIVKNLKPYIDNKFRTKKGVENTFIAGSSMGGLISLHALFQYPDVFGGAGVFSPAFWIAPQLYQDAAEFKEQGTPKIYFYAGGRESASMLTDMDKMIGVLQKKTNYRIRRSVFPLGEHNEKAWRSEFAAFYSWLMQ